MGQFKCSNNFIEFGVFLQIFQLVIRGEGQLLSDIIKTDLCLRKFQPVIIGAVQIASEKLPYFFENFCS